MNNRRLKLKKYIGLLVIVVITAAFILFSGCTPPDYQLSTSVTPLDGGTINPSSGIFKGGSDVTLVATPAKYYEFTGWAGDISENTSRVTIRMNSNKNIVASFKKTTYNLQSSVNPIGGGTLDPTGGSFEAGNNVRVTVTPASGYRFGNWGGSATGNSSQIDLLMDNNKTINANFIRQFTLKVTSQPLNAGNVSSGAGVYDQGNIITLSATPNFPYYPKTWIGTDTNTNPTTVTMNSDKSAIIIFEPTIKSEPLQFNGNLTNLEMARHPVESIPIELKQYEWVQGEIKVGQSPQISTNIQDPNGKVIKEFGPVAQASFSFMAQTPGIYTVTFTNTSIFYSNYYLSYTIYHLP